MRSGGSRVRLSKTVEDVRKETLVDADAGVRDDQLVHVCAPVHGEGHGPAGRRELHGVREQVPDHLLQPVRIAGGRRRRRESRARSSPRALRRPAGSSRRRARDRDEINRPHVQPQLARGDSRDLEEVLDQPRLREGVALDLLEGAFDWRLPARRSRAAASSTRGSR